MDEFEIENVDFVNVDLSGDIDYISKWKNNFDTVIMNPPFGTKKNKGMMS